MNFSNLTGFALFGAIAAAVAAGWQQLKAMYFYLQSFLISSCVLDDQAFREFIAEELTSWKPIQLKTKMYSVVHVPQPNKSYLTHRVAGIVDYTLPTPAEQPLLNEAFRSYNFDTIDGVSYSLDVTQPARYSPEGVLLAPDAHRVRDLRFEGKPIDLDARFVVATNNYRAFGGGNFPGLGASKVILEAPEENRQVLVEYLRMSDKLAPNRTVNPAADGNWKLLPVPGVRLTFPSASAGQRYLDKHPQIHLLRDNGDGSAVYEIQP